MIESGASQLGSAQVREELGRPGGWAGPMRSGPRDAGLEVGLFVRSHEQGQGGDGRWAAAPA